VTLFGTAGDRVQLVRVNATRRIASTLVVSLAGLAILCSPAYAYLDPGTGSVVLQLLLGGLAGLAAVAKLYWAQIVRFVRGRFARMKDRPISNERQQTIAKRSKRQSWKRP
jgi:hypothetical protein